MDVDIHHGVTVSFHKFGGYFPGTGDIRDTGYGKGKYYAVNVPLDIGMDDDGYEFLFKPIVLKVMEGFRPGTVVLQCSADSLWCFSAVLIPYLETDWAASTFLSKAMLSALDT